ncbi:MAG: hypothetical protein AAGD92_00065 [Pseudomonadota bacterium]
MKVIIHIGSHKTGTTSIQKALQKHHALLLSDYNLYTVRSFLGSTNASQWQLNVAALEEHRFSPRKWIDENWRDADRIEQLRLNVSREIRAHIRKAEEQGAAACVFTNEGLFLLRFVSEWRRLQSFFVDCECELILVLRDRQSFRQSYMQQLDRMNISLSANSDSFAYVEEKSWLFDYDGKVRLLRSVFGPASVRVLQYEPKKMVSIFFSALGIVDNRIEERFENRSVV